MLILSADPLYLGIDHSLTNSVCEWAEDGPMAIRGAHGLQAEAALAQEQPVVRADTQARRAGHAGRGAAAHLPAALPECLGQRPQQACLPQLACSVACMLPIASRMCHTTFLYICAPAEHVVRSECAITPASALIAWLCMRWHATAEKGPLSILRGGH